MRVNTKQVLKYALLPGLIPMVRALFASGFGNLAFFMATIYAGIRLLPANHAYLNTQNIGRFGISNVILEAFRNLRWKRENLDQICIFILLLSGLVLLVAQFALMGFAVFTQSALATSYAEFLTLQDGQQTNDIAFILMDRVFGIPDLFNSCVSQPGVVCLNGTLPEGSFPAPYHLALQDMMAFYSVGLCVIGLIIFLYYIVTIVVETAQTGTPFGRRFNHVWAPVRMVVALALLIPISYGLNGAQLLTLHVAKWGSSFATNGWNQFVNTLVDSSISPLGDKTDRLIAKPRIPSNNGLLQFYTVLAACRATYLERTYTSAPGVVPATTQIDIDAYLVSNQPGTADDGSAIDQHILVENTTWQSARDYYRNGDIIVVFGAPPGPSDDGSAGYSDQKGGIIPWCGELVIPQVALVDEGTVLIQQAYYNRFIKDFWRNIKSNGSHSIDGNGSVGGGGGGDTPTGGEQAYFYHAAERVLDHSLPTRDPDNAILPDAEAKNTLLTHWHNYITTSVAAAIGEQINSSRWLEDLEDYGWAGAGIWYNRIAELNGALIAGIVNVPQIRKWPIVMEKVAEEKGKHDKNVTAESRFSPFLSAGRAMTLPPDVSMEFARTFALAHSLWHDGAGEMLDQEGQAAEVVITNNAFTDFLKMMFGIQGMYNMRDNTDIHPLAQIVAMGKYLLEAAIINLGMAAGSSIPEKILGNFGIPPAFVQAIATMLSTVGMMTLIIGFVLYYVVPFLPFMYFFFQVGGWIKGLFEAMVGLPLWALAHLRIDGDGLAGAAAINGYFLLLDIFLRPILIVFGMIGGMSIFAAQVQVLNETFDLVISNLTGFNLTHAAESMAGTLPDAGKTAAEIEGPSDIVLDPSFVIGTYNAARGFIDQFFFTVIYAIIVYMMGTASFKLVYMIPDNILRWMGSNVDGFGEIAKSTPDSLVGTTYTSAQVATSQMGGALRNLFTSR